MQRQNFLSHESFVEATEKQAKESVLSIPVFAANIHFTAENKMLQSFRFRYRVLRTDEEFYIDVSILPLNDRYTRIGLRASQVNGHAFFENKDMNVALKDFECAIVAAVKGDTGLYMPTALKEKKPKKFFQLPFLFATSESALLKKNLY